MHYSDTIHYIPEIENENDKYILATVLTTKFRKIKDPLVITHKGIFHHFKQNETK